MGSTFTSFYNLTSYFIELLLEYDSILPIKFTTIMVEDLFIYCKNETYDSKFSSKGCLDKMATVQNGLEFFNWELKKWKGSYLFFKIKPQTALLEPKPCTTCYNFVYSCNVQEIKDEIERNSGNSNAHQICVDIFTSIIYDQYQIQDDEHKEHIRIILGYYVDSLIIQFSKEMNADLIDGKNRHLIGHNTNGTFKDPRFYLVKFNQLRTETDRNRLKSIRICYYNQFPQYVNRLSGKYVPPASLKDHLTIGLMQEIQENKMMSNQIMDLVGHCLLEDSSSSNFTLLPSFLVAIENDTLVAAIGSFKTNEAHDNTVMPIFFQGHIRLGVLQYSKKLFTVVDSLNNDGKATHLYYAREYFKLLANNLKENQFGGIIENPKNGMYSTCGPGNKMELM